MKLIKTIAILLVICAVFGAAMFALDLHTGPIIEQNNKGEFGNDVLLYSPDAPGALTGVSEQVLAIYQRESGFAIQCYTVGNYVKDPIKLTVLVSSDGIISEVKIDEYPDSIDVRDKDANFIPSFTGKDSALADVNIIAGCTFSSKSIKEAVEASLNALVENNLIAAGVKDDSQILAELIPTVFPGMSNTEALGAVEGTNITNVFKSMAGTGFAYIVKTGENSVLAVVNAMGNITVYDVEGIDVTEANAEAVAEVAAHYEANKLDYAANATTKLTSMVPDAGEATPIALDSYNTLVYAVSFSAAEVNYYGFYSRSIGFGGHVMDIYVVIDENGAITKLDAKDLVFEKEYFGQLDKNFSEVPYKEGFVGATSETYTEDIAVIGGATMSTNCVKSAVNDSFAAFENIKGGEQ